jgi:tetratricopeptide (TPR) repeat protein
MTVRRSLALLVTLAATFFFAACNGGGDRSLIAETDEPLYVDAKRLERQGRYSEALVNYKKLIEKRGERFAPESHLDAGIILKNQVKDPIEAIHHLNKYLELEPNSQQAAGTRALRNQAMKEFGAMLPGRPLDQAIRVENTEDVESLRRENAELRAQLQSLRGNAAPVDSRAPRSVTFTVPSAPQTTQTRPAASPVVEESPLTLAPPPLASRETSVMQPAPMTRTRAAAPASAPTGKKYIVKQGDGLYAIARQAAPGGPAKKLQEILEANRDVLPNGVNSPIKPGMELRIP